MRISDQLCNTVLAQLRHGLQNLEELKIRDGRVLVLFQLEGVEQELSFPSLKVLDLEYLEELECLCKEELFGHKDEADMKSHREMVLPQLQQLTLQQLASLVNFCHVGYHFIFPSLSRLFVTKCPKIAARFSVDQNRSMHAEAEVLTDVDDVVVD
ncbi:hypothetical protein QYF36_018701 [Acer negundo]|nr:hypothetical protein QYF36_018701 [Acer negundo]